jgi:hypothetical protein
VREVAVHLDYQFRAQPDRFPNPATDASPAPASRPAIGGAAVAPAPLSPSPARRCRPGRRHPQPALRRMAPAPARHRSASPRSEPRCRLERPRSCARLTAPPGSSRARAAPAAATSRAR